MGGEFRRPILSLVSGNQFFHLIAVRLHQMVSRYVIFSIPAIVVTWVFGFLPWGLVTAFATPFIWAMVAGLVPKKSYIRFNVQTALEGLSYGRIMDAQERISSALRDAEEAKSLDRGDLELIATASEKVAASLAEAGKFELAQNLRDRCAKLTARFS